MEYFNTYNPTAAIPYNSGSTSYAAAMNGNSTYGTGLGPYGKDRIGGVETYETGLVYIGQNNNLNAGPCDPNKTGGTYPASYPGCVSGTDANSGEQVLFETGSTDYSALASAPFTATTVTVSGLTDTTCGYYNPPSPGTNCIGEDAVIVGGTGLGQNRHIIAQSGDLVTVSPAWQVIPDATSKINIANISYQFAVYDNLEQGKTDYDSRGSNDRPSIIGVENWGNVFQLVYDSNQVSNAQVGIEDGAQQETGRPSSSWICPSYFNLFTNNKFEGIGTGIGIGDAFGQGQVGDPQAVGVLGEIFRDNTFGTSTGNSPNTGVNVVGVEVSSQAASIGAGNAVQGLVLDSNSFTVNPYGILSLDYSTDVSTPTGLWTDAGDALVIDTLMNNNTFTLLPNSTTGYTGESYGWVFGSNTNYPPTPAPATKGDSCYETGSNTVTGFATASTGLTCTQK